MSLKDNILSQGYYVVDNFFDINKFNIINVIQNNLDKFAKIKGDRTTRYINLLNADQLFSDLILETGVLDIAHEILGLNVNLSDYHVLTLHGGAPSINAHIDYPFLLTDKVFYEPIAQLQTLWVLDDFTTSNGATQVVPGSHLECCWPDADLFAAKSQKLILKKGSLIVFHGALWHSTSINETDKDRSSMLMSFCPPWVKPLMKLDYGLDKTQVNPIIKDLLGNNFSQIVKENLKNKQKQEYIFSK